MCCSPIGVTEDSSLFGGDAMSVIVWKTLSDAVSVSGNHLVTLCQWVRANHSGMLCQWVSEWESLGDTVWVGTAWSCCVGEWVGTTQLHGIASQNTWLFRNSMALIKRIICFLPIILGMFLTCWGTRIYLCKCVLTK